MYLQIKKVEWKPNKFGQQNLEITMIWLYEDDWKWIKWVKLNNALIETLKTSKIQYD